MDEIAKIEAEEVAEGKLLPKINIDNAPRSLDGLLELPRIVRWRLALSLGFPTEEYKDEYKNASAFVQSHMLKGALRVYDLWRREQAALSAGTQRRKRNPS